MEKIKKKIKKIPTSILILTVIVLVGIFLRTHNFHAWLEFDNDQARDAALVSDVVTGKTAWPLLGPTMKGTNDSSENLFHVGPMYYYFEIISAKIFGNYPDKLAYPDLIFSILTIPLFYYFLKKYFSANLSLALAGLWTFSYFAIKFSRFAWNTNSMPFFILLFLLGLGEFLFRREKTSWWWALALGIALGVGVQLHAMLLVMFPFFCLGGFFLTVKSGKGMWLRWGSVLLIALVLNAGQIVHELDTNFQNTYAFFQNANDRSGSRADKFSQTFALDAACHVQSNAFMPSALGDKDHCNFLKTAAGWVALDYDSYWQLGFILAALAFSLFGYAALVRNFLKETDRERKIFFGLALGYIILFFIIMFASIQEAPLRYFLPSFFVPYLFLGFLIQAGQKKYPRRYFPVVALGLAILLALNVIYLLTVISQLEAKDRSGSSDVILGELESMRDYIITTAAPSKTAYFSGGSHYVFRFLRPLQYLAGKDNFSIKQEPQLFASMKPGEPVFYIYASYPRKKLTAIKGMPIVTYKNFGQVAVYEVIKTK
ncbi:MAG: glycosyltransferase family 39 protein [Candidatus Pacebacteria bacterium]|nr:glycosyltransferase family 39 protein [Candidatus Paceibacterota bacterium]MDR3583426.1 glycosyltransferase family 39 protein [Candidatus Paceibacterota bacterium]